MAGPIQTIPQGLLGLLQLKELGMNPPTLLQEVTPTLDLTSFYLERLMQSEIGLFGSTPTTAAAATVGLNVFVPDCVVPQTETWWLVHAGLQVQGGITTAADTLRAAVVWRFGSGAGTQGPYTITPVGTDVVSARAPRYFNTDPMNRPIWLPPGAQVAAQVEDLANAGAFHLQLVIRAARIPI